MNTAIGERSAPRRLPGIFDSNFLSTTPAVGDGDTSFQSVCAATQYLAAFQDASIHRLFPAVCAAGSERIAAMQFDFQQHHCFDDPGPAWP
jgi:hypothetical protein